MEVSCQFQASITLALAFGMFDNEVPGCVPVRICCDRITDSLSLWIEGMPTESAPVFLLSYPMPLIVGDLLRGQVVGLGNVLVQIVLQTGIEGSRSREDEFSHPQCGDHEHAFSVLGHSVILCVKDLETVGVSYLLKLSDP